MSLLSPSALPAFGLERWPEVLEFDLKLFHDERGFFSELYNDTRHLEALNLGFVQDNLSLSKKHGVLRGLHFQIPPHAQGKFIAVPQGSVLDVIVDIRLGSPNYGKCGWMVFKSGE